MEQEYEPKLTHAAVNASVLKHVLHVVGLYVGQEIDAGQCVTLLGEQFDRLSTGGVDEQ